ncbi:MULTISPECIES: 4-phosphoerythronate dehydrogenase [unclassified Acinetobacter]|uniref:4-phosphoerythronate dehydrogenase n=1 Tax=unclassified Acinetobacter TaxID=196816 RepID=UPI0029349EDC|nr:MULTISPECIES: 4-phosphoerythronate dehydrogenase [unclassified Acinetobacter]WOE33212.1 4-phosphoerythronate dehydrogenase [Acinetobacter sp. SAAs470]WOE37160.1 4-phosphoerythronate dehydrogenase [Acinetobacter sp. SAAs474]
MKIIADENLAFTEYFFSDFGEISQHAGRTLSHQDVQDADVLLIRSVTQVDADLINNSSLKFIGSATIGTDHLDQQAIEQQHIAWSNAAGCNAQAVAEYVISALLHLKPDLLDLEQQFTLGIVGLGNVGSRLATMAMLLGWKVIAYDPFVQSSDVVQVSFTELLKTADAISIHVPLTQTGRFPTYHLFNTDTFAQMPAQTMLINSARGAVVEEMALMADIDQTQRQVVLDVFEHEPEISLDLLNRLSLATPHIAGYSLEGKARGTQMIYEAFCRVFSYTADKQFTRQLPLCEPYFQHSDLKQSLKQYLSEIYDIARDDQQLRACVKDGKVDAKAFDYLRKTYPLRREWAAYGGPQA